MRSEFESREAFECIFGGEDGINLSKDETGEYSFQPSRFAYSFFLVAWQYRQTEVDELTKQRDSFIKAYEIEMDESVELQRRNQMLNDNIKEQGQKLVYQNEVIETQAEKLLGLRDEKAELQKRVDELQTAFKQLIEMENESISFEHDLFDKGWNQSARQTIENIYKLTGLGEQALKGGSDE